MPVTVSCTGCGKQLTVKDEFVGKRLKCPQCGATFTASAAQARSPGKQTDATPRIHLSPGIIALIATVVIIMSTLLMWNLGPGKVRAQWDKMHAQAEDDIKDVVGKGLQAYMSTHGSYDPSSAHAEPHAIDLTFIMSPLPFTMPETIAVAGTTTQGGFAGKYHPNSGEVDVEVEIGGISLPGAGVQRHGDTHIQVTGRNKAGAVTVEVDGKAAGVDWSRKKSL